jgi:cytochrome b6-f complex iron-sulfur subunit
MRGRKQTAAIVIIHNNGQDNVTDLQTSDKGKRDFLKYVLGGGLLAWAGSVMYPLFAYLRPPKQAEVEVTSVKVGKLSAIEKDSGTIVRFGNKPVIVIRTASGEVRALSATCTHLDCTVQYRKDLGVIWCACHNGKYDLNGRNIAGPPPRPLDEYRVVVQAEEVFISKKS